MATKVYDAATIREKLVSNDKWLVRGILAIYAKQTADEKVAQITKHNNGIGFNGRDATILSSFAKQILSWQAQESPRYPSPLSPKQFAYARRAMPKYSAQLARIAVENNPAEDEVRELDPVQAELEAEALAEIAAERAAIVEVESAGELTW